jgi:predicted outer membrane lipoprotein
MSDIEFELKKRFAELREDDAANAPSFTAVRDRGRAELEPIRLVSPRTRWIAPALLAAAAAVLAALWVAMPMPSRSERARQEALLRDSSMNVFRWTMPTDGLLTSARRTLQTPALSGSVLDAAAVPIPGTPFKGD